MTRSHYVHSGLLDVYYESSKSIDPLDAMLRITWQQFPHDALKFTAIAFKFLMNRLDEC